MKRLTVVLALLAAFSFTAKAQDFTPFPYVQLQGGVSYDFGDADFLKLLSPAAQVAVGYQFNDCFSARLAVNGWQAKHTSEAKSTLYGYKFVQPNIDLVLDWGAGLFGWREDRPVTIYSFIGVGSAFGLENSKANELAEAILALCDAQGGKSFASRDEIRFSDCTVHLMVFVDPKRKGGR